MYHTMLASKMYVAVGCKMYQQLTLLKVCPICCHSQQVIRAAQYTINCKFGNMLINILSTT